MTTYFTHRFPICSASKFKTILPAILSILLFIVAIFLIALPSIKTNLIDHEKNKITVLTQTAWNIISHHHNEFLKGNLSLSSAQSQAITQIRELRYGYLGKDYFWINDIEPSMIMHPYLPELEGKNLSNFTDKGGSLPFVNFVNLVKEQEAGFVPYFWQWNDLPERISPKLSYVKLFQPWEWVIGTGVYLDDVKTEIKKLSQRLFYSAIIILFIISYLLYKILLQTGKEIRDRQEAERKIIEYQENLEELVERRTKELKKALDEVKILSGFLPICSSCKNIRDDKGYWSQIESYIKEHSEAEFTHSLCPTCAKKLYPEFDLTDIKTTSS